MEGDPGESGQPPFPPNGALYEATTTQDNQPEVIDEAALPVDDRNVDQIVQVLNGRPSATPEEQAWGQGVDIQVGLASQPEDPSNGRGGESGLDDLAAVAAEELRGEEARKRARSLDGLNEDGTPSQKRRSRKGPSRRLTTGVRSRFEGDDDEEFAERVQQEYLRVRQKLIDDFGDSGAGRQRGWRMHLHSRMAIAKRLREEEQAAYDGTADAMNKKAPNRSRKSGAYSIPSQPVTLAGNSQPEESGEDDASDGERAGSDELSGALRGRGRGRWGRGRSGRGRGRGGRGRGRGRGLSRVKETLQRLGRRPGLTRSSGPKPDSEDENEDPEDTEDKVKANSLAMQSEALAILPVPAKQMNGPGVSGLGPKPLGGKILGLGAGLPFKRPPLAPTQAQPFLAAKPKEVKRDYLHVDGREKQNHCAVYRETLYISGIRAPDALLQIRNTYEGQLASILDNLDKLLRKNGSSKNNILTATVVLQNVQDGLPALNDAWDNWIPDPRNLPPRTVMGGSLISPDDTDDVLAEISLVAALA